MSTKYPTFFGTTGNIWSVCSRGEESSRKVHINEARMAARMQELHLDNNNLEWHPNLEEEPWYSRAPDERPSNNANNQE